MDETYSNSSNFYNGWDQFNVSRTTKNFMLPILILFCCFDIALQSKLHTVSKSMMKRSGSTKINDPFRHASLSHKYIYFLRRCTGFKVFVEALKDLTQSGILALVKRKNQNFHWLHWGQDFTWKTSFFRIAKVNLFGPLTVLAFCRSCETDP